MEETKLIKILDGLRYDLDLLLQNHYSLDEGGFNDVKEKLTKATESISNIRQNLTIFFSSMVQNAAILSLQDQALGAGGIMINVLEIYSDIKNGKYNTTEQLTEQVDTMQQILDGLALQIENIVNSVDANTSDIASLDERLHAVEVNSGGGSSGDLSNVEEDITNLQNDVSYLQLQINSLKAEEDKHYTGKSFSDYPLGTIIQTYDYLEYKNLKINSTGTINLPPVNFCCEAASCGKFKVHLEFNVKLLATDVGIKCNFNDNLIDEEMIDVTQTDFTYVYDKTFADINYNIEDKNNCVKVVVALNGSASNTRSIEITHFKVEVFGPNADILNKICPVDICEFQNQYYISDCRSGVAKFCKVNNLDIVNIKGLTFEDTGKNALKMQVRPMYEQFDTNLIYEYDGCMIIGADNKYYIYTGETLMKTDTNALWRDCYKTYGNQFCVAKLSDTYRLIVERFNTSISTGTGNYHENAVSVTAYNCYNDFKYVTNFNALILVCNNGLMKIVTNFNSNTSADICYGHSPMLFITEYKSNSNFNFDLYYKYFDKIIYKKCSYVSAVVTVHESFEVGAYDYYFKNKNGSYFAMKDNVLTYHIEPPTQDETE